MDVDEVDVDPASIEHSERTKEPGPSEGPPVQPDSNSEPQLCEDNARTFLTLYVKIVNAEDKHEVSNQEVIRAYYFFNEALS
ncbi:unnamed protein product [Rhizophagus irregularis]|nr:unnamed protein product [Rhizophagus irregularis]